MAWVGSIFSYYRFCGIGDSILSVNDAFSTLYGGFFELLQFRYRLTNYVNLGLLTAILALLCLISNDALSDFKQIVIIVCTICVTISFCALISKLLRADTIVADSPYAAIRKGHKLWPEGPAPAGVPDGWRPGIFAAGPVLTDLPPTFYSVDDFSVSRGLLLQRPLNISNETTISFQPDPKFGVIAPVSVSLAGPALVVTNVQPFSMRPRSLTSHRGKCGREKARLPVSEKRLSPHKPNRWAKMRSWQCHSLASLPGP
jgi:hypothetical protein